MATVYTFGHSLHLWSIETLIKLKVVDTNLSMQHIKYLITLYIEYEWLNYNDTYKYSYKLDS